MVEGKAYQIGNVFLKVGKWKIEVTVIVDFYTEAGKVKGNQVARGSISTTALDFWKCVRDIAEQHRDTKEIMTAIDMLIENAEAIDRRGMDKMRKDAEAVGYKGSQVDDVIRKTVGYESSQVDNVIRGTVLVDDEVKNEGEK